MPTTIQIGTYSYAVYYNTRKIITTPITIITYLLNKVQDFFEVLFLLGIIPQLEFYVQTFLNYFLGDNDSSNMIEDE